MPLALALRAQPLRRKLPLLIAVLLIVVVAALASLGYRQLQQTMLAAAHGRVVGASQRLAVMLSSSATRVDREARRIASEREITGVLARANPSPEARDVASRRLRMALDGSAQLQSVALWRRDGEPVLTVGAAPEATVPSDDVELRQPPRRAPSARDIGIGPIRVEDSTAVYDLVVPSLDARGDTVGYLVETRRVSGGGVQQMAALVGSGATLILGDSSGREWTDLARPVDGPVGELEFGVPLAYERGGVERMGGLARMDNAPWLVAIEMTRREALAPAYRFLVRASGIALVVLLVGVFAAWFMSRSMTGPLETLVSASEGIAAGDYSQRVPERGHEELRRVAASFNTMAERVEASVVAREQALAEFRSEVTGRRALEAQLQQAQKMEAVGQLAGGVAHDFNNLLTVITSYSDLLLTDISPSSAHAADVREIQLAASRAAALTRQLLAFSRRQILQPRVLDPSALTMNLEKMLRRLLREDIELEVRCPPGVGFVNADPNQLEQIIVNLAVNARDAMPDGGRLTIETARVECAGGGPFDAAPGAYACLAVTDTGHGMDEETREHIFDPFFTTKPVGEGTGLGLATVYGIVKQSEGHIRVSSAPGQGARFEVYLPIVSETAAEEPSAEPMAPVVGGPERILLVEDEPEVRRIARRMLERRGYEVVEAANGAEALRVLERRREPIALVLTDLVMPEMGGRELAAQLRHVSPSSRVLFMTGYSEDAMVRKQLEASAAMLLEKPFTLESLTRKVREALSAA
jgi:signal transduction histidine kinase